MSQEPVARPHPEHVVLDIGGEIGALIIRGNADLIDTPIEISPTGQDASRTHQHILERPLSGQTLYAAVFDKMPEGTYTLWIHGKPRARDVAITGGHVLDLDWSHAAPTS